MRQILRTAHRLRNFLASITGAIPLQWKWSSTMYFSSLKLLHVSRSSGELSEFFQPRCCLPFKCVPSCSHLLFHQKNSAAQALCIHACRTAIRPSIVCLLTMSLSRVMQALYLVQGFQWLGEYSIFITWVGNAEYILKVKCQRSRSSRDQTECYNGGSMHLDGATSRLTCFTCAVTYTSHFSVQSAKTGYSHFWKNPTHSKILKQNSKYTG